MNRKARERARRGGAGRLVKCATFVSLLPFLMLPRWCIDDVTSRIKATAGVADFVAHAIRHQRSGSGDPKGRGGADCSGRPTFEFGQSANQNRLHDPDRQDHQR